MESKFIIVVVFASLMQSCSVLSKSSTSSYGLSEQELARIPEIEVIQDNTMSSLTEVIDSLFYGFKNVVSRSEAGLDSSSEVTEYYSYLFGEILAYGEYGLNNSLNAVLAVAGNCCTVPETARKKIITNVNDTFSLVVATFQLIQCGKYPDNSAEVEANEVKAQKIYATLIENLYEPAATCLQITDAEKQFVMKLAINASMAAFKFTLNSVFDALKVLGAAISAGKPDETLIPALNIFQDLALSGFNTHIEIYFSLLKALYVESHLNQNGFTFALAAIQYADAMFSGRFIATNHIIFESITASLQRVALGNYNNGLYYDGLYELTRTIGAQAKACATLDVANRVLLNSIQLIQSYSFSAIEHGRERLPSIIDQLIIDYYRALDIAQYNRQNGFAAVDKIERIRDDGFSYVREYVEVIFDLIFNRHSYGVDDERDMTTLKHQVYDAFKNLRKRIFHAIIIVAKTTFGTGIVSIDDLSAIRVIESETISAVYNFSHGITTARMMVLPFEKKDLTYLKYSLYDSI